MTQWSLLIDDRICFDCRACEVACMQENNLSHVPWINVVTVGPREASGNLLVDYIPVTCHHCAKPRCADACPTKAINKREDGIVDINADLCIGCKVCISACPFAVIRFNTETNVAEKCTLCTHRIKKGLKPACVQHCQAGAIFFGEINEITERMMKRRLRKTVMEPADDAHSG